MSIVTVEIDEATARRKLLEIMTKHYDKRATTLKDSHPLGVQVNLETGVANGVLVVRTIEKCINLVYSIMTNNLQLDLKETDHYTSLVEKTADCIFRVATNDQVLTNTFWNFYLDPA